MAILFLFTLSIDFQFKKKAPSYSGLLEYSKKELFTTKL